MKLLFRSTRGYTNLHKRKHNTFPFLISPLFYLPNLYPPFPPRSPNLQFFVLNSTWPLTHSKLIYNTALCDNCPSKLELFRDGTLNRRFDHLFSWRNHAIAPAIIDNEERKTLCKPRDKSEIHCIFLRNAFFSLKIMKKEGRKGKINNQQADR